MKSTVGEKGQVTIPKALRDSLALRPGTELEFEEQHGKLVAWRAANTAPVDELVGLLPRTNVDAAINDLRGYSWSPQLDERSRGQRRR
jgi:AbrB family looped-hinge helix DNA binding protein